MVSPGWLCLAAMIVAYGVANLLQSVAATRTTVHHTFDPALLVRLAGQRPYVLGLLCQVLGFVFAFLARRDLPLFLVQASVAAGLGVTALLGVVVLKWCLPAAEVGLLALLLAGITALVLSARPAHSRPLGTTGMITLAGAIVGIAVLGFFAVRLRGVLGSVVLGSLAGVGFSAAAIAARPLASEPSLVGFFANPLLYLLVAHSLVGQLLLGLAMQRGSTTAAVAAMDAAGAVPAAIVGLLLLGDRIEPGREWLAGAGFVVTLGSVIALTRYAEPQHHHATGLGSRAEPDRKTPGGTYGVNPEPGPAEAHKTDTRKGKTGGAAAHHTHAGDTAPDGRETHAGGTTPRGRDTHAGDRAPRGRKTPESITEPGGSWTPAGATAPDGPDADGTGAADAEVQVGLRAVRSAR